MRTLPRPLLLVALVALAVACGGEDQGDRFHGLGDVAPGADIGFVLDTAEATPDGSDVAPPDADTLADASDPDVLADASDPDVPADASDPDVPADAPDAPDATDVTGAPSLKVTPSPLDFGDVDAEGFAQRQVTLKNTGDQVLVVDAWTVTTGADHFLVTASGAEDGGPLSIEPGETTVLDVAFNPGALPAGPVTGKLRLTSNDPVAPLLDVLLMATVVAEVVCTLVPDQAGLAFGSVAAGCGQATRPVSFTNPCPAGVVVTKVHVKGAETCGLEFGALEAPLAPFPVAAGATLQFQVRYHPLDVGPDACKLSLATSVAAPDPEVGLSGSGTGGVVVVTDAFHQVPGNKADVLFVVDGSGSMTEHVEALADDIGALAESFNAHGTDFHLGAVGISAADDCSTAGHLMGDPHLLTSTSWQSLHDIVVGAMDDECANSGTEAGLAAASLALSPALTAETSTVCTLDLQCGPGMACVDGLCGGPNRGFLRADASLHVLVISDEDDQSPASVQTYVNGFLGIKGTANPELFRFHAIAGKPGQSDCPDGSYADPGLRYREAAALTGGKTGDICTNDFAAMLADIGDVGVAFKTAWTLSQAAAPASVSVAVEGQACGDGFTYVQATHQVVVDPDGACMPGAGQTLTVSYATACGN